MVNLGAVHQKQRLCGGGGGQSPGAGKIRVGPIEKGQIRMPPVSLAHQIDRAVVGVIHRMERIVDGKSPGRLWRERMPAGPGQVECAADKQHLVAQGFRIKGTALEMAQ